MGIKGLVGDIHDTPAMGFLKQQHGSLGLK
jgi:hypothetical protein